MRACFGRENGNDRMPRRSRDPLALVVPFVMVKLLTRREAIAAGLTFAASGPVSAAADKPRILDTHTHFYDPTRKQGVPWPGKYDSVLYRTVLPAEYRKLAEPHGIVGTVVVEASPWVEDNQWLLDLARDEPFIVGVVGRLLPGDAEFAKHLAQFSRQSLFRGIRWNAVEARTALEDAKTLDRLKALSDSGLSLDLNGGAETFLLAAKLAEKLPALRIVVDHVGNPLIDGKEPAPAWREAVATGGKAGKNVWCKLSGLVDGTHLRERKAPTELAFYQPVLDAVWKAFGADRLVFGSNWPVSEHYADFKTVLHLATNFVQEADATAFAKVFRENATTAYQLKVR